MKRSSRFKTLRDFVNSHPRTTTQAEIAAMLGVPESTLSGWLGGDRFPSREVALRLSRDFAIDLRGLLDPEVAA